MHRLSGKATNWEGGFRVPTVVRWPGVIKLGAVYNDIFAHMDFIPTFCAAGAIRMWRLSASMVIKWGIKHSRSIPDGYNLMPFFKGEVKESPRKGFLYWSDDGDIFASGRSMEDCFY